MPHINRQKKPTLNVEKGSAPTPPDSDKAKLIRRIAVLRKQNNKPLSFRAIDSMKTVSNDLSDVGE
jgi:hypothetical protein